MIALGCAQGSDAWRLARCGHLTASRAHDILARGRGAEESVARGLYRRSLVCERLTGVPEDDIFASQAMRHGRAQEPAARAAYAERTGLVVETSGFLVHDTLRAGCSIDGHVGAFDGLVEIKAPNTATHLRYLMTRRVPLKYRSQIRHQLWITGARWCDFVSFDDRLPARFRLVIVRLAREQMDVPGYEREARRFLADVGAQVEPLEGLRPVEFFQAAPLDVARHVLASCMRAVEARKHERPALAARVARQAPLLSLSGRAS